MKGGGRSPERGVGLPPEAVRLAGEVQDMARQLQNIGATFHEPPSRLTRRTPRERCSPKGIEGLVQGGFIAPLGCPSRLARVVVDRHRDVPLPLLPADLVARDLLPMGKGDSGPLGRRCLPRSSMCPAAEWLQCSARSARSARRPAPRGCG